MTSETLFWIEEVRKVLAANPGQFTRSMIATELAKVHQNYGWQELMNMVSVALEFDKDNNPRLFERAKPGWWRLAGRG